MLIADVLAKKGNKVFKILQDKMVMDAVTGMASFKVGAVVVVDPKDGVLGIFTERDVTRILASQGAAVLQTPVGEHMTPNPITCTSTDDDSAVLALMSKHRFRHMPVLDHGTLIGIVSIRDVVSQRLERVEFEAEAMRAYVTAG
jgi:CBS domain-containing protein